MKDIFISEEKIRNSESVPDDVIPKRYAVATNILCTVRKRNLPCMLIYNSEPKISNTWYPFYSTINSFHTFSANNYKSLVEEYKSSIITGLEKNRITPAAEKFSNLFNSEKIEVDNLNRDEFWLKYSKSVGVWTIYLFEYFLISKAESISGILSSENDLIQFLPLDDSTIAEVLSTGLYKDVPLVENIKQAISNTTILEKLRENAL